MTCVSLDALTGARAAGQQSTKTAVRVMFSRAMRLLDEPCWTVDLCMPCKLNTSLKKLDPAQSRLCNGALHLRRQMYCLRTVLAPQPP